MSVKVIIGTIALTIGTACLYLLPDPNDRVAQFVGVFSAAGTAFCAGAAWQIASEFEKKHGRSL